MKIFRDSGRRLRQFTVTASGTATVGAPAALANDNTVADCADQAEAAIGWFMSGGTDGDTVDVLLGYEDVSVEMAYEGTPACIGRHVGLDVTMGVFKVDMDNTTQDLFKVQDIDTTAGTCRVSILPAAFQFGAAEVS